MAAAGMYCTLSKKLIIRKLLTLVSTLLSSCFTPAWILVFVPAQPHFPSHKMLCYAYENHVSLFSAMRGIEENPTPELAEEIYQYNKTFKMIGVAVAAHEIGHLLGAPEVSQLII
jgi:hypothetical protein